MDNPQHGILKNFDPSVDPSKGGAAVQKYTQSLKSSLKYSKPVCLQNMPSMHQSRLQQSMVGTTALNRSVRGGADPDDLNLKLDKLTAKFLDKNREKDAFKDVYFDEEIFKEILASKNYFKLSLELLKYTLHSANLPKKKVEKQAKGAGFSLTGR